MKIGDFVAHKDQDIKGKIVSIHKNFCTILSDEGFEYSFEKNNLVLIGDLLENALVNQKIKPKESFQKKLKKTKSFKIPEFDLHIEKIQPKHKHLSSGQKLQIQLEEVQRVLNRMKPLHHPEIIFIHGHGRSVLKKELQALLKNKGFEFYDASFAKYGGGALRVILNNKKK